MTQPLTGANLLKSFDGLQLDGWHVSSGCAPLGAVMQNPVDQGLFETDVPARLFRLEPFMPQDFLAFSRQLAKKRGPREQLAGIERWAESIDRDARTHT